MGSGQGSCSATLPTTFLFYKYGRTSGTRKNTCFGLGRGDLIESKCGRLDPPEAALMEGTNDRQPVLIATAAAGVPPRRRCPETPIPGGGKGRNHHPRARVRQRRTCAALAPGDTLVSRRRVVSIHGDIGNGTDKELIR
jgi:hypothetical protein